VHFAMQQQAAQLVQTAVNIADGVSERLAILWQFSAAVPF
jgi:hypothetical protein